MSYESALVISATSLSANSAKIDFPTVEHPFEPWTQCSNANVHAYFGKQFSAGVKPKASQTTNAFKNCQKGRKLVAGNPEATHQWFQIVAGCSLGKSYVVRFCISNSNVGV